MNSITVIDSHCDTLTELLKYKTFTDSMGFGLKNAALYDGYVQFFAAWIDKNKHDPYTQAIKLCDCFYDMIDKNSDCVMPVFSFSDIESSFKNKLIGALLSIEGGEALCGSIDILEQFYVKGVRSLCLLWNYQNEIGVPAYDIDSKDGLTPFGKEVVRKMNELNMLIDVSHLNERGFYDVISTTKKPIIASHSCAFSLCSNPRNLRDEQFKEIIATNSVVGINFYPPFLSESKEASVKDIVRHILHFLELGGENNIGIGSDFDGVDCLPSGITSNKDIVKIASLLYDEGVDSETIDKIMWKNTYRLLSQTLN